MLIFIVVLTLFSLYLLIKGVEYRESIKRLQNEVSQLRNSNQNLASIMQEDLTKLNEYENECG
mgnify:CR=1 FL=1